MDHTKKNFNGLHTEAVISQKDTPENVYKENERLKGLTPEEKSSVFAWDNFALTENQITKHSRFHLDHYKKVKAAR